MTRFGELFWSARRDAGGLVDYANYGNRTHCQFIGPRAARCLLGIIGCAGIVPLGAAVPIRAQRAYNANGPGSIVSNTPEVGGSR